MENLNTNLDLFVFLRSCSSSFDHEELFSAVKARLGDRLSDEDSVTLKEFCRKFTRAASQRWQKSHRFLNTFRTQYQNWLQANVDWPSCVTTSFIIEESNDERPSAYLISPQPSTSSSVGTMTKAPRKAFEDLGRKQKKRGSDDHKGEDSYELAKSAALLLRADGHEDAAFVIEYILENPEAAAEILEMLKKPVQTCVFTPEKALDLIVKLKLSKWQYIMLRESAIREGAKDIYPPYYKVQQAKRQCYPLNQSETETESDESDNEY